MVDEIKLDDTIDKNENPKEAIINSLKGYRKIPIPKIEELNLSNNKPFFIIPLRFDKFIKENVPEKKKYYIPKTELAKRTDKEFYKTFYSGDTVGIFADYDDLVAKYIAKNPQSKLAFNARLGKVEVENGESPTEINNFIRDAKQYGVSALTLESEGSVRRLEERQWFEAINGVDITNPRIDLLYLQNIGLLDKLIPDISQQELINNKLTEAHRQTLGKFYRRRQMFWHTDIWNKSEGLTPEQKETIGKMSRKINRIGELTR